MTIAECVAADFYDFETTKAECEEICTDGEYDIGGDKWHYSFDDGSMLILDEDGAEPQETFAEYLENKAK